MEEVLKEPVEDELDEVEELDGACAAMQGNREVVYNSKANATSRRQQIVRVRILARRVGSIQCTAPQLEAEPSLLRYQIMMTRSSGMNDGDL